MTRNNLVQNVNGAEGERLPLKGPNAEAAGVPERSSAQETAGWATRQLWTQARFPCVGPK